MTELRRRQSRCPRLVLGRLPHEVELTPRCRACLPARRIAAGAGGPRHEVRPGLAAVVASSGLQENDFDLGPGAIPATGARRDLAGVATLDRVWLGQGAPQLEVGLLEPGPELPPTRMRAAWRARRGGRAVPVMLVLPLADRFRVCGPEDDPPQVRDLPPQAAVAMLRRALALAPDVVVEALRAELARSVGSGGVPGLRNERLVSTHYLVDVLPTRPEWSEHMRTGSPALCREGDAIFRALGFDVEAIGQDELLLRSDGVPLALAHLHTGAHRFDRILEEVATSAGAHALARAARVGARYGMLAAGPIVRLLTREASPELGESVASAAYLEVATDIVPPQRAGIIGACYAPGALRPGGHLEHIRASSARFAVGLRERFRDRVYEEVVPSLVRGIAAAARRADLRPSPELLYRATMLALFRTLFVLYAEDRDHLPVANPDYQLHSLTRRLDLVRTRKEGPGFEARQTDLWEDIQRIFLAIARGSREWGVPPYDGGLFVDDPATSEDGALLAGVKISNADFGPALYGLAIDRDETGAGKVDFGALGVRHIGNLYEGLLSYEVGIAEEDLTVDPKDPSQPYVPAKRGDEVKVHRSEPYLRSPKGGRKATGSYYTPDFVVDRIVGSSVAPAFDRHITALRKAPPERRSELLWDFRICDPAMGSGHFLVSVVDALAERVERALPDLPDVVEEVARARSAVQKAAATAGATETAPVKDVDVIRRLVLKRCVYGVDLNPMAVELARLSLWLHAFVPGLPLSYLGHTMRVGNSLVGVVGTEVMGHLERGLFANRLRERLDAAADDARTLARSGDLELHEIALSEERQRTMESKSAKVAPLFDAYAADPLIASDARRILHQGELGELSDILDPKPRSPTRDLVRRSTEAARGFNAFHWQLAFPEVYLRDRPGFDAIVANPPWDEVTVEELGFYTRYMPGLKSETGRRQRARIAEFAERHPDVRSAYERRIAETERMRAYIRDSYELSRSGDPDLYKAFAERFLALVREGGALGVVLPRSAFAGEGSEPFRERLFTSSGTVQLDFLLNKAGWVFADAEPRYTIALVVATKQGGREATLSAAGPADSREAFARLDETRTEWPAQELKAADYAVPLVPQPSWAELLRHCYTVATRFDHNASDWLAVPWRELDATNDRKSGLLKESGTGWRVYSGDSFDLWKPEHEKPPFVLAPETGLVELQRKRKGSSVWRRHFSKAILADPATLPQHRARILFRDVTRATDSRTVRACLVPPEVFAVNTAPSLLFPRGDELAQAYVLGVLCSLPFDWLARRRVETHLNFFVLGALPFPKPPASDPRRDRVAKLAARLACIDERFAVFARASGVASGPLDEAERSDIIAELDALAARLYRLTAEQLEIVFADFTTDAVPPARREAVRRHFARLQ